MDTEIDKRLDAVGSDEAKAAKGKSALANARLAYEAYEEVFGSDRWAALDKAQANKQRPLWASTGVKDPSLKDTLYVDDLVAPNTVNTMPEATLDAVADHGEITGNTVAGRYDQARADLDAIKKLGVSYDDVVQLLEDEGVEVIDTLTFSKADTDFRSLLTEAQGAEPDAIWPLLVDNDITVVAGNYDVAIGRGDTDCGCGYSDPRDNEFAQLMYDYTLAHTSRDFAQWMTTLPTERGLLVGNGSMVAAIVSATGVEPRSAGKPLPPMFHRGAAR